jgi:hypothetical protein
MVCRLGFDEEEKKEVFLKRQGAGRKAGLIDYVMIDS